MRENIKTVTHKVKGILITRKGEFIFEYYLDYHPHLKSDVYFFKIWKDKDGIDDMYRFSYLLKVMENANDLKVVDLYANKYNGQGISIAIILKSKELFNKRIISSSNKMKSSTEENKEEAIQKVWDPLVNQGLAKYDEINGYYYVL